MGRSPRVARQRDAGEAIDELMHNLREAIEGCLSIEVSPPSPGGDERMLELAP